MAQIKLITFIAVLLIAGCAAEYQRIKQEIHFDDALALFANQVQDFDPDDPDNLHYGVIIDLGPGRVRLHIYKWVGAIDFVNGQMKRHKPDAPIERDFAHDLLNRADGVSQSVLESFVSQWVSYINENVAPNSISLTGVGVLVPDKAPNKDRMSSLLSQVLRSHDFAQVKIISQDRTYEWMNANEATREPKAVESGNLNAKTVVDIGEQAVSLTQVLTADSLRRIVGKLTSNEARLAFADNQVTPDGDVYSDIIHKVSFPGLGTKAAHELHLDLLIAKHMRRSSFRKLINKSKSVLGCSKSTMGDQLEIEDPCALKGFTSELQHRPVTMQDSVSSRASGHSSASGSDKSQISFIVKGTGSFSLCKRSLEELLAVVKREHYGCSTGASGKRSCAVDLLGEPFVLYESRPVVGSGELSSIANLLNPQYYDRQTSLKWASDICATPYERIISRYKRNTGPVNLCFNGIWIETLLARGFGMPTMGEHMRFRVLN